MFCQVCSSTLKAGDKLAVFRQMIGRVRLKGYGTGEKHSGDIPKELRNQLTEVIASNLRSENLRPLSIKVGSDVDNKP